LKIKSCPQCGSTDIGPATTMGLIGLRYKCKDCDYEGDIIIERDIEKT